ncbi:MAG TPA: sugar-transfer associated ATP-grasp domain-containing protein [Luteitalea sp.]|nr:sugar-transfer associated ATP-grasp domain-containing protein [Luteitalea sp.]
MSTTIGSSAPTVGDAGWTAWRRQARAAQNHGGGSLLGQALGMLYYWARIGTRRREYYMYRLYDPRIPLAEKLAVLSTARWYGLVDRINPRRYHYLVDDKTAFATLLRQFKIPTPAVHDVLDTERRAFASGIAAGDARSLLTHLRQFDDHGLVLKDEEGRQGRHVYVIRAIDDDGVDLGDRRLSADALFEALMTSRVSRYVVQERVMPHPALRPLAGQTLPTIRIVTYRHEAPSARVLRASMRIPRHDTGVDNFSAGNLAAAVDIQDGTLGPAVERDGTWHSSHPVTGAAIEGVVLPQWGAVLTLVERAASALSRLPTVGWDVAITAEGPCLIEGNSRYNFNVIQLPQQSGLWRGDFQQWCESTARRRANLRPW